MPNLSRSHGQEGKLTGSLCKPFIPTLSGFRVNGFWQASSSFVGARYTVPVKEQIQTRKPHEKAWGFLFFSMGAAKDRPT